MNKPHKHAEVIKAWADGQDVQFLNMVTNEWSDIGNPTWRSDREYRVKPQKKKVSVAVVVYSDARGKLITYGSVNDTLDNLIEEVELYGYNLVASFTHEVEIEVDNV